MLGLDCGSPFGECRVWEDSKGASGDEVALEVEAAVDRGVGGEKLGPSRPIEVDP